MNAVTYSSLDKRMSHFRLRFVPKHALTHTHDMSIWILNKFVFIILSGGEPESTLYCGHYCLLYQPHMIDDSDCGAIGGMKIGWWNPITRRKPAPCHFVTTNLTWPDSCSNPSCCGGKPATSQDYCEKSVFNTNYTIMLFSALLTARTLSTNCCSKIRWCFRTWTCHSPQVRGWQDSCLVWSMHTVTTAVKAKCTHCGAVSRCDSNPHSKYFCFNCISEL
jgi:hypothetical protein